MQSTGIARKALRMRFQAAVFATFILVNLLAQTAAADIYSYVDESGISHFTNCPGQDARYKLVYRLPRDQSYPSGDSVKVDCSGFGKQTQAPIGTMAAPAHQNAAPNSPEPSNKPTVAPSDPLLENLGVRVDKAIQPTAAPSSHTEAKPKDSPWIGILTVLVALIALWLITQRWFWVVVLSFGALASFFAMAASVIHFQILAAVGFFVLACICGGIASTIADA